MPFASAAGKLLVDLLLSVAKKALTEESQSYWEKRKLRRLVEETVDIVVRQADEFLASEGLDDDSKLLVFSAIVEELKPHVADPKLFHSCDLDANKIYRELYANDAEPQAIRESDLVQYYSIMFKQVAHLVGESPATLKAWEAENRREGFRRMREMAEGLGHVLGVLADIKQAVVVDPSDELASEAEFVLKLLTQTLVGDLSIDLSPLLGGVNIIGSLSNHFVKPAFLRRNAPGDPAKDDYRALVGPAARSVVYGVAGAGKSTWAQWLQATLLTERRPRLALLLRLRELPDIETKSLLQIVRSMASPHLRDQITDDTLKYWRKQGRLVVIVDGFDELPLERRDQVETWLWELGLVCENASVIVTSRPLQSSHLDRFVDQHAIQRLMREVKRVRLKHWSMWALLPFDRTRIVEYIEKWHEHLSSSFIQNENRSVDARALADSFLSDPTLESLANTPLMLGTLLFVHYRERQLPNGRVDLYGRFTTAMLGFRDTMQGVDARAVALTETQKRQVVSEIALHFHLKNVDQVADEDMRGVVSRALSEHETDAGVGDVLDFLAERSGLLQGPGTWSFAHKTISEYFVAELVVDGMKVLEDGRRLDRTELSRHRSEDRWTTVIFFWAGTASRRELEELITDLSQDATHDSLLLALSLMDDQGDRLGKTILRELAKPWIRRYYGESALRTDGYATLLLPEGPVPYHVGSTPVRSQQLRGLSTRHNVDALARLFARGALTISDVIGARFESRAILSIATIGALGIPGTQVSLQDCMQLPGIGRRELALHTFAHGIDGIRRTPGSQTIDYEEFIHGWLNGFPEAIAWVPLLIPGIGEVCSNRPSFYGRRARKSIGPLMLEWMGQEIDGAWLKESRIVTSSPGEGTGDILEETRNQLLAGEPESWGVSHTQLDELVEWCARAIEIRDDLK